MRRTLIFILSTFVACTHKTSEQRVDSSLEKEQAYIRAIEGEDEHLDSETIKRGEVLISYSDCAECHKSDKKAKGPAFQDIAKRYPIKQVYIDLLAQKVKSGSRGSWGSPIMPPHPRITDEDAKAMVSYILSLEIQP
ncbi:c-type cytochrome [Algoriphagus resistens]|uniref:c-type cytochrome n=1 Tax=Algoriphagus resistens TaxID=1750590 RepID=UPI000B218740|nr:c-type cytochrome [Algoriphagus resistens]